MIIGWLTRIRSGKAQSMVEFALVAPILFLMLFGIVDLGRVVYYTASLNQAANEGARVAIRGEPPDYATPSDVDVETAVKAHATAMYLANPCPNGPIPSPAVPPANQGWIFITEAPAPSAYEASPPPNAPGGGAAGPGQTAPALGAGCNPIIASAGQQAIQVTLYYTFVPITPLIQQIVGNHLVIHAYAVYRTEY